MTFISTTAEDSAPWCPGLYPLWEVSLLHTGPDLKWIVFELCNLTGRMGDSREVFKKRLQSGF